ncbi:unnamed protein product [Lactuca saligna]|uniref:Polymerase nucleotidyl transferase domain-containing protein n=1 Tax=Lactuca saligna TaxID=75948 RepID=A0AA35YRT7_LACSI|nr:unnamed protein product [Lactuca saligna]
MGDHEEWSQPRGPNGLLPNAGPLLESLDSVRWLKAEERTAELISCIQPNQPSEERRNAVADYVQRLIMKCFPCQVFTFGSVPLKTYLPDGDIDLTAFSNSANLKDSWASEVRDMLEIEEKNENAEFHVKEVQYIQAEVKIIKCLVENIVVDISFNQLGGLCTLCFLEEVDNLINQNHLFKRSIILIKAWCYYESRILGAHHGLISTYALETLVLYIFHVFNNSFAGPLEVLYRFLEFFSNFDWENFCVSLWGPVPISSLPDVTAEPPRKDSGELLLNKVFLDACSSVYAVFPGGQDNQGQTFVSKHFNVIDPLRVSNNLGRSVSKGNFFRIRSAFAFGAKRLAILLDCPQENLVAEVNQFFTNTWERHGSGIRPDAPGCLTSVSESQPLTDISKINSTGKKFKNSVGRESEVDDTRSRNSSRQLESGKPQTTPDVTAAPRAQKGHGNLNRGQKNLISGQLVNDIQRVNRAPEIANPQTAPDTQGVSISNSSYRNRRKNIDASVDSNNGSSLYQHDSGLGLSSMSEQMHQEEQDLVNMMASSGLHGFNGQVHMPMSQLPFPFSPSFLAGMGYAQRNFTNFPMIDPAYAGMQFPHGLVSPHLNHFFSGIGMTNSEDPMEPVNDNFNSLEINSIDHEHDSWSQGQDGNSEIVPLDVKRQSTSSGLSYVPPPLRVGGSGGVARSQQKYNKEKRGPMRNNNDHSHSHSDHLENRVVNDDERTTSSRFSSAAHSNSLKSKTSSESSWDESSTVSKKEKRGKKVIVSAESSSGYVKGKTMFESTSASAHQSEDDDLDSEATDRPQSVSSSVHAPRYELAQTSGNDSIVPIAPMILGHNRQRMMDNSGAMPLTFYPTGPPVPFLTMLPFYNVPSQPSPSDPSTSHFCDDVSIENGDIINNQSEEFNPDGLRGAAPGETPSDILNSDFASHWQNLQFGRYCQSPRQHGPTVYPSPVMVPPVYLQGRVPWDGPGRPLTNMNIVTQLMNYGPRLVPVAAPPPVQSVSRPPNVYQQREDLPRYRSGTGTYLPNPKVSVRERHSSGSRRGNYNHDRSENHNEGNWNGNSKSRGSNRNHSRNQMDKSNSFRAERSVNSSYRHDTFATYQTQNGPLHGSSSHGIGMYQNPSSANGSSVPSMVMVYPYEHNNMGYGSHSEQLEFGSIEGHLRKIGYMGLLYNNDLHQISLHRHIIKGGFDSVHLPHHLSFAKGDHQDSIWGFTKQDSQYHHTETLLGQRG